MIIETKKIRVGFIGLGNMGLPMVLSLLRSKFQVHVYDKSSYQNIEIARNAGAINQNSLGEVASSADIIIAMLPNGKVLNEILFGSENLNKYIKTGSIILDMSSSDPSQTQATSSALAALNIDMIDAPVIGGVTFAKDATLDFLVGGNIELIKRCEPIFSAMGKSFTYCGPIGSGHALKSLTNYVNTVAMTTVIEAINIGKKFGIDELVMSKSLIETCTGRNHPIIKKVIPRILTKTYDSGMALGLVEKDLRIAIEIARKEQCEHPFLEQTLKIISSMVKQLGPDVDQTKVANYWRV